jgi:hypothetical protein
VHYTDLIEKLQTLPAAKQAEVLDFVEFLAQRDRVEKEPITSLAGSPLAPLINNPMVVPDFTPFSREEANAR